jgi:hypothetical protein
VTERLALSITRVVIAACLLIVFPIVFGLSFSHLGRTPELIAWGFLLIAAGRIIWLTFSASPRLFDLAFWIFVYVFFGLAAQHQIATYRYPLFPGGGYTDSQLVTTQIRIAVGIAAYIVGVAIWNRYSRHRGISPMWERLAISERRVQVVGMIGLIMAVYEIFRVGLSTFFSSRDVLSNAILNATGQVKGYQLYNIASKSGVLESVFLTMPALVALVYLIVSGLWKRNKALFVALVVANVIVNNPISNPRAWTGVVIVGLLAALVNLRIRSRSVYFALGILLSLLLSLGYLNIFRSPETRTATNRLTITQQLTQSPDFAMFQQEVDGTEYVSTNGFTDGKQLAGSLFVFVPRSVWHSKAGPTGILVSQFVGLNGDWSSSLWTEFYIDFGYPELIVGFILLGSLFTYMDRVFATSKSTATRVLIPILATYTILFIRGSLEPEFGFALPLVILLFVCLKSKPNDFTRSPLGSSETGRLEPDSLVASLPGK